MPRPDRRSVGELLADSDMLARETLAEVSAEGAPAVLRSWGQVVQAAGRLWAAMPPESLLPRQRDPMVRLVGVGAGISRAAAAGRWPGGGAADERMLEISSNLTRAALLVERYGRDVQPTSAAVRADIAAAHARLLHTLYVTAHSTSVAVQAWLQQAEDGSRRSRGRGVSLGAGDLAAGRAAVDRLQVFEQLAGAYVAAHPVAITALGERQPLPRSTRLQSALSGWHVQVHRTLNAQVELLDLVRIARVHALIVASYGVVADAAGQRGLADWQAVERMDLMLQQAELAWTRVAHQVGRLVGTDGTTDPALVRAAAETRAVIATTICTPTGWARPDQIAARADLTTTGHTLQQALVAGVDVAHQLRDVLTAHPHLTVPARLIALRLAAQATDRPDPAHPEPAGPAGVSHQPTPNQRVPLPSAFRDELVATAEQAAATSQRAFIAAAVSMLKPPAAGGVRQPRPLTTSRAVARPRGQRLGPER